MVVCVARNLQPDHQEQQTISKSKARLDSFRDISKESMSIGFNINEVMSGHDNVLSPFVFNVTWGLMNVKDLFKRGPMKFNLEGTVLFKGTTSPCHGHLIIDYFETHTITYIFNFHDPQFGKLMYVGEKVNIKPWNLPISHTTCFGTVSTYEDDTLLSRTLTFFFFFTIPKFLTSFRLRWR